MRKLALILLFTVSVASVRADEITEIRDYYTEVKERIDDEYDLYRTEIFINTEDESYPALGNYQEEITFYWGSEGGSSWLVLAVWSGEHASHNEYGEVLFSEPDDPRGGEIGELVFQFVSFDNNDDNMAEVRWWFSQGELLQSAGETVYSDGVVYEYEPAVPDEYDYAHSPAELLDMFNSVH